MRQQPNPASRIWFEMNEMKKIISVYGAFVLSDHNDDGNEFSFFSSNKKHLSFFITSNTFI